jgi:hypothetical protein
MYDLDYWNLLVKIPRIEQTFELYLFNFDVIYHIQKNTI